MLRYLLVAGFFALTTVVLATSTLSAPSQGDTTDARAVLATWLTQQAQVSGWHARVTQTRTLPALNDPLETSGQVWFQRPNRFRWELGDPPRSIAVRQDRQLVVHYPRLERTERYPLDGDRDSPEQQALALLEIGFPEDADTFLARYELIDAEQQEGMWTFRLQPATATARRFIERLHLVVEPSHPVPHATELAFADGSTMRNVFHDRHVGAIEDEALFRLD